MNKPLRIASCVALLGVVITLATFAAARRVLTDSFQGRLRADVSTRARLIQQKLEETVVIARAAASFEEATGAFDGMALDRSAFDSFTGRFIRDETGLTALSLVAAVPAGERERFETRARKLTGRADFRVYEGKPGVPTGPLGERAAYYPVLLTNTREASALAILGYDLGSSAARFTALEKARDTGEVSVTGRITLAGTAGKSGFIIFAPVYGTGRPPSSAAERRATLKGFVQAIFSLEDLVVAALRTTTPVGLPFELLDLSAAPGEEPVYRWTARLRPAVTWRSAFIPPGIHALTKFPFAGRDWAIDVHPNPAYLGNNYPVSYWLALPCGLALSFLFASYIYVVLSRREKLVGLNAALEAEIARRELLIAELRLAQHNIRTLEGILPICSSCKKIRDEQDTWVQVESYVSRHTSAEFSHGICPECVEKLYPELRRKADGGDPKAG